MTANKILKQNVVLIAILALVKISSATFLTDCMDGYYFSEGRCLPCDSSCKTCSDGISCDTCEKYMFINSTITDGDSESPNLLCEYCPEDQYYDRIVRECRPCGDNCIDECLHRPTCFSCPEDKILDLETLTCIDTCASGKLEISSEGPIFSRVCKNSDIFIDHFSNEVLELGTEQYPYRTMKAATSEILAEYSHSNVSITIYTKDVFLEIDTFYILNMTSVKIQNHPEYQLMNKKSSLVITSDVQPGLSKKCRLHLLQTWSLDPSSQIAAGGYTESELSNLSLRGIGVVISRTNFEVQDIEVYGTGITYTFLPLYLQQKHLRLENMYINVTGLVIPIFDPLNLYLEGIVFEVSRAEGLASTTGLNCHYPEAEVNTTTYINNITFERTLENPSYSTQISIGLAGNKFLSHIDCTKLSSSPLYTNACFAIGTSANCNPPDDIEVTGKIEYTYHDGNARIASNDFVSIPIYLNYPPPTRKETVIFRHHYFSNMNFQSSIGLMVAFFSNTETVIISDLVFKNVSQVPYIASILYPGMLTAENLYLEENINLQSKIFEITAFGPININNVHMKNYTNVGSNQMSPLEIIGSPYSSILLYNIYMDSVELFKVPFLNLATPVNSVTISDSVLKGVKIAAEGSLFHIQMANAFMISNVTVENSSSVDPLDTGSKLLSVNTLNYAGGTSGEITGIKIENSSLSLFSLDDCVNVNNDTMLLSINSIEYTNSVIATSRSLFSTEGISVDTNLQIEFSNLTFEHIEFVSGGSLLEIMHKLPQKVTLSNSTFNEISSGSIVIEGSRSNTDFITKLLIQGCTFTNILTPNVAFMRASQNSVTEVKDCSFTNFTSLSSSSGIINAIDSAQMVISTTNFTKNSAVTASIFKVETEAEVTASNCNIFENFAVTNGVFEVASFGVLTVENSKIYRNYAIQYPVGTVFLSVEPSYIISSEIYENRIIYRSSISSEISDGCGKLCFLKEEMKNYLEAENFTAISEQEYILQVLQGNMIIMNSSKIYDQSLVMNCFLSTVVIESSTISNLQYSVSPMNILDSNFTIKDTTISSLTSTSSQHSFIVTNSGRVRMENITYQDSNSQMLLALSSKPEISMITFRNVSEGLHFISGILCESFYLSNIKVYKSVPVESSMIHIQNSKNITLEHISLSNVSSTFASLEDSEIEAIFDVQMTLLHQPFQFVRSEVKLMSRMNFTENSSNSSGGAILMHNSKISIQNSTFLSNSAVKGGAIIFECTSLKICALEINSTSFKNNSASMQGGAISYNYMHPKITEISFVNNSAAYGHDFASYPARIGYINSTINDDMTIDNIGSGVTIANSLRLALIDLDNQVMQLDDESQILILPQNSSTSAVSGTNVLPVTNGTSTFDNIAFEVDKNQRTSSFVLSSKSIDSQKVSQVLGTSFQQKILVVNFRDCEPGERILDNKCLLCSAGTYSLEYNSTECSTCDLDADCLGGSQISLKPGFWRRFHNSTNVVECVNRDSCKGGYSENGVSPAVCSTGYTGNLCGQCAVDGNSKYQRVNDFECSKCPDPVINAIRVILSMIVVLIFFILMVIINVRKTKESEFSVLLRILTNYLQLITVSISMISNYPSSIMALSYPANMVGSSSDVFLSFDCFLQDGDIKLFFDSNSILKLFLLFLLPLILFIILTIMWIVVYYIKKEWVNDLKRNIVISFITIVFLLHPKLTENSIRLFNCVDIDDGHSVVKIDTNIECFSSQHLKWILLVAIPILVIWVFACPILALWMIYYGKRNPERTKISEYFIMIYQGLKPNAMYWEFVNTLRKIVILISLLLPLNVGIIISLSTLILTARIEIWLKPYKNPDHYKAEFLAIMAGVSTITSALIYSMNKQHTVLNSIVFMAILLLNVKFLIEWAYLFVIIYKDKNNMTLMIYKIMSKLLCKTMKKRESFNKCPKTVVKTYTEDLVSPDMPSRAPTPKSTVLWLINLELLTKVKKFKMRKLKEKGKKCYKKNRELPIFSNLPLNDK